VDFGTQHMPDHFKQRAKTVVQQMLTSVCRVRGSPLSSKIVMIVESEQLHKPQIVAALFYFFVGDGTISMNEISQTENYVLRAGKKSNTLTMPFFGGSDDAVELREVGMSSDLAKPANWTTVLFNSCFYNLWAASNSDPLGGAMMARMSLG
jgi:hypothetical protein